MIASLYALATSWFLGRFLSTPVLAMLAEGGVVGENYRGERIPVAAGVLIPLASGPVIGTAMLLFGDRLGFTPPDQQVAPAALFLIVGLALLGLLDDTAGNRSARGLAGHLRALLHGRLTTGAVKAVYGVVHAMLAVRMLPGQTLVTGTIATLLVALGANAVNLLDLRPGRALKAFMAGYLLIAVTAGRSGGLLLAVTGAALALLPIDLQAKAMLGDTGANVLGGVLGLFTAAYLPLYGQMAALFVLLCLHLIAERWSISAIIDAVPVLHRLDMWGRPEE